MLWILAAVGSSFFAGLTAILAKLGIKKTDSDVATTLRTTVVLIFSWIMVFITGSAESIHNITSKSLLFLVLSGIATGASWLCYFKALSIGDVNKVAVVDKSSTILSVLLAIILFGETNNLLIKLFSILIFGVGVYLMIEKKTNNNKEIKRRWLPYALASALFASLTTILAKVGIENVESNLGTAIRTSVVLMMSLMIVLLKKKENILTLVEPKELLFIVLSGIATGGSWLCYYYAIQNGIVSVVVPIDKLSVIFTVLLSFIFFHEKISKKALIGLALMLLGTLLLVFFG